MIFSNPGCRVNVDRAGKSAWDRKWIVLRAGTLYVYNDREESSGAGQCVDEFDLRPRDGVVYVRSAVTQTELANVAVSDLPYVLMLEFEPDAVNRSNRLHQLGIFKKNNNIIRAAD